jgi:hypothetical protein
MTRARRPPPVTVIAGAAILALALTGCSNNNSGGSPATPTTPTTPTPAANRAPVINAAAVSPAWGMATLTSHAFSAAASDPDGDALTYAWSFGNGTTASSAAASVVYGNAETTVYDATLTVTDARGATATSTIQVTSASMTGTWTGMLIGAPVTVRLTQAAGGIVTGSWDQPTLGAVGEVGPSGAPGLVKADGSFDLRFKVRVGSFVDFYYRGNVDPGGRRLNGNLFDSGFTGQPMPLDKQ